MFFNANFFKNSRYFLRFYKTYTSAPGVIVKSVQKSTHQPESALFSADDF